jgi:hypothetical protein
MIKMDVKKFSKIKEELKKFRKSIFGKKDKLNICHKFNVTTDEINIVIKYLAYERMRERKSEE